MRKKAKGLEPQCDSCENRNREEHDTYYWCDHYKSYALMMKDCKFYKEMS